MEYLQINVWNGDNDVPLPPRQFPVLAFVVGVMAGAFGIGGGLIQAPLMLALGVVPGTFIRISEFVDILVAVMSVTSMFVVLLNSTATLIQYISNGTLPYDWALWFLGFSATGAMIGKAGVDRFVGNRSCTNALDLSNTLECNR